MNPNSEKNANKFFKAVADRPIHDCICCDRLWFKSSMKILSKDTLISKGVTQEFLKLAFKADIDDCRQVCKTCYDSLMNLKIPELAVSNGFIFPDIPDCLKDLTLLEERLVACRIPFMQIYPVRGCQYKIKGSVVNVPIKLDSTVNQLPRNLDDSHTVHVKLKRRLTFKSNYMYEIINPQKVFKAAEYLMQQELYRNFDVGLNMDWYKNFQQKKFDVDKLVVDCIDDEENEDENEEHEVNPSATHTLISPDKGICLAPGENQKPISVLFDKFSEELAFPTIYCGKIRHFKTNPTYTKTVNSEIRRRDRRASRPDHLLYAYCKYNHYRLLNAISISIRKKKSLEGNLTAGDLLNEDFVDNLITHNEGYKFLKNIKNSPPHWEKEKKRCFAAIRQFGLPTLFVTVSAAETHWFDLMKTLSWNLDRHELTEEEFVEFSYEKKCELIQKDPVTCALYFDYRFRELMKTWKSKFGAFNGYKISHYYYRIEFQHRGSPHAHMIIWLEEAPLYSTNNAKQCEEFIDQMITCSNENAFKEYQMHRHTETCYRKNGKDRGCRFNIPYFPMDKTRILEPYRDDDSNIDLKTQYELIREYLSNIDYKNSEMTFDIFLSSIKLSFKEYINIIRSGINRPTVFLQRDVKEIMLNNYNPKILNLMQSNMDIQYITDGYACVAYMVDYINKSQRGMSKLIKQCIKNSGNNLRTALKTVANEFLNSSEISAQEAAWCLLELPMSKLSDTDIFIPTFPPGDRARIVKKEDILKQLPKNSCDVYEWSIIDKYVRRPHCMEDMCLADFVTNYEFEKSGKENEKLLGCNLYARKRRQQKVLRCVNYKKPIDSENFYREQITLYTNWRDEDTEILNKNLEMFYKEKELIIEENRKKYHKLPFDIDEIKMAEDEDEEKIEIEEENYRDEPLEFENDPLLKADINRDMDEYVGKEFDVFKIQNRWEEITYQQKVRNANIKQYDLLKHIMHLMITDSEPFHIFITGPAGCGKSYLISILEQTFIRWYDKRGLDPSTLTVLKVAPTGKAAYNIKALTLHSAFAIPTKQTKNLHDLCPSTLNEYRSQYQNLKVIIIDEISMVGYNMFRFVDQRLRQIMGNDKPFGNISMIIFGDFRQLPPVGDSPIYQIPKSAGLNHLAGNILWNLFRLYELDEIMRQKEDMSFAKCLNNLADGNMTKEDTELIKSRIVSNLKTIPSSCIHMFFTNFEVDEYNAKRILQYNTQSCVVEAYDTVTGSGSKESKKLILQRVKNMKRTDTSNLAQKITLKIDAKYMIVFNINISDGLVNGAMGILKKFEHGIIKGSKEKAVQRIWMEFEDKEIGKCLRQEYLKYMIKHGIYPHWNWTPIERLKKIIYKTKNCSLSVCRSQFPITVSEAITIHKSQGATYKECAVHLKKLMRRNLVYVGLSRATRADGLYIVGEFELPETSENDRVKKELERLRLNPIIPVYRFLHERDDFNGIQFMYHNIEGLATHYEDLLADPCFTKSDLILLAETGTLPTDYFKIPGFKLAGVVNSNDEPNKPRRKCGVITYIKDGLIDKKMKSISVDRNNIQILVSYILKNIRFAVIYASPQCTTDEKIEAIVDTLADDEERKTVLVGDFNIDFNSEEGKGFYRSINNFRSSFKN